jgi:dihydroorotase
MRTILSGGRVIDPANARDEVADLLIEDGTITAIDQRITSDGAEVIDVAGLVVAPGLVDMHTHLREPGREDEETIASGSAAAAAGGFTGLCAMPNTDPVADTASVVEQVWALGREVNLVEVLPAGALSKNLEGKKMADLGEMARSQAKVRLFTDDGHGIQDPLFARRAMEYLMTFDATYAEHCEDAALAAGGHMHEGSRSMALGLRGIPAAAEELMAARDIALAKLTGCKLHLLHISTEGTVELVRRAKEDGLPVTAEATPHHFSLTDLALETYDPCAKVNPPLRTEEHVRAIIEGLADGTIDAIATDHAPHAPEEKDQEFEYAPPGLVGLETALGLALTELVHAGHLGIGAVIDRLSTAPARLLGMTGQGTLAAGTDANIVVFDPERAWTVDPARFFSKSRNTPFGGRELKGRVVHTFFRGRHTVTDGAITEGATV